MFLAPHPTTDSPAHHHSQEQDQRRVVEDSFQRGREEDGQDTSAELHHNPYNTSVQNNLFVHHVSLAGHAQRRLDTAM